jgi:hypothetical protein
VVAAAIRGRTARRVSSSPCLNVVKAALREALETTLLVAVRETVFRNMVVVVVVMIK